MENEGMKIVKYANGFVLGYRHSGSSLRQDGKTAVSNKIDVKAGDVWSINDVTNTYKGMVCRADDVTNVVIGGYITDSITFNEDMSIYFEIRRIDGENITTVNGFDKLISNVQKCQYFLKLENNISEIKNNNDGFIRLFHKIGVIGDSLSSGEVFDSNKNLKDTYTHSWLANIARKNGLECEHFSKGGLTAKTWLSDEGGFKTKFNNETYPCNAYYLALGTNDKNKLSLGTINDKVEADTFVGYYKQIIENIHMHAPNAVIFCVSLYRTNELETPFSNMIRDISNLYDYCFFIDFANNCDKNLLIPNNNGATDFIYNYHYNGIGYIRVSNIIEQLTNNIISNNLSWFRFFAYDN